MIKKKSTTGHTMCQDICFLVKFGSDLAEHARASGLAKK
jgi:hypothetical protein